MEDRIEKGARRYYLAIAALFMGSMVCFGAEYCVQPIVPVIAESFGLSPTRASMAVSAGTLGMSAAMVMIAIFARRFPRRKVMSCGLAGAAVLAVCISVSENFHLVLLCRLLQGILLAGFPAMAIAYINEEFSPAIIGAVVGIYVGGNSIGGLVGRILLSTLTDLFSWRYALMVLSVVYLVMAVLFFFLLPKEKFQRKVQQKGTGLREFFRILRNRRLLAVYFIGMSVLGVFVCNYNFITYVLLAEPYNLSQTAVGFVYLLYLLGTLSSAVMGAMTDRKGNGLVAVVSLLIMAAGMMVSMLAPLLAKIAGLGMMTFGFFGAHSAACSWVGKLDPADKASLSALYMLFYYFGASVYGSAGGIFLASFGWDGIVFFSMGIIFMALCAALWLRRAVQAEKEIP